MQDDNPQSDGRRIPSRQLNELLARALLDQQLCERLLADPATVGQEAGLSSEEIQAVKLLDRAKFEAALARLRWG